jgi:hypothetical protein
MKKKPLALKRVQAPPLKPVKAPLKGDRGFFSQQCPRCNKKFKAALGQGSAMTIAYCPYCGRKSNGFWTRRQKRYLECVARHQKKPGTKPLRCIMPLEIKKPTMKIHKFPCHNDRIKYLGSGNQLYCIVCGC